MRRSYEQYVNIATRLAACVDVNKDSCYKELLAALRKIDTMKNQVDDEIPFIFVTTSSGWGKTQLAFTLQTLSKLNSPNTKEFQIYRFHYLLGSKTESHDQPIYKAYAHFTHLFLNCAKRDMKDFYDPPNCTELSSSSLYSYGFVDALLNFDSLRYPY